MTIALSLIYTTTKILWEDMKISFGQNDLEPSSKLKSGLLVTTLLINLVTIPAALPQELSRASVD